MKRGINAYDLKEKLYKTIAGVSGCKNSAFLTLATELAKEVLSWEKNT